MDETELTQNEDWAKQQQDDLAIEAYKELRKTRKALKRYLQAHEAAVHAVGTSRNMRASEELRRAFNAGWRALGERPPFVEQLL